MDETLRTELINAVSSINNIKLAKYILAFVNEMKKIWE